MAITLSNLKPTPGSRTSSKRIGRGAGSGHGTTAGRGTKGQRARSGGRKGLKRLALKRIMQRVPKLRGFTSIYGRPEVVNVGVVAEAFDKNVVVTPQELKKRGIIRGTRDGVKVLGEGNVTKALTFKGVAMSASAKAKIEKAGGKVE